MSDMAEEYTHNRLDVKIFYDTDTESPREWDNVGTMICSHRNYNLGDEQFNADDYDGWDDLASHLIKDENAGVVIPLYLYDHSGITMFTKGDGGYRQHEEWDSGQVGFIYVDKATIKKEWGAGKEAVEKAKQYLLGEVKTYDQYLTGDVYGFSVTNPKTGDEIDSCWGFYGVEAAREEADSMADYFVHPHDAAYAKNASIVHG